MTKVLITGGSGFIGSHMVSYLLAHGDEVVNFDVKPPENEEHVPLWKQVDIRDSVALRNAMRVARPETLLHMAARAEISSTNWSDFASIHLGTNNLIDAIEYVGGVSRFVNVSTQLVIGPGEVYRDLLDFRPYTTYGRAKAEAEMSIIARDPKSVWVTVRPTNIWGPGHPSFGNSVWKYLAKRQYLHPQSSEPVIRCYGYVKNTVDQIAALLVAPAEHVHRKVFYLADGAIDSTVWLDGFSQALSGSPVRRIPAPFLRLLGYGGHVIGKLGIRSPIDTGRVMRMTTSYKVPLEPLFAIAGEPRFSFHQGVAETVPWLKREYPEIYGR